MSISSTGIGWSVLMMDVKDKHISRWVETTSSRLDEIESRTVHDDKEFDR